MKMFWRAWVAARGFSVARRSGGKYCEFCSRGAFGECSGAPAWTRESFQVRAAQVELMRGTV